MEMEPYSRGGGGGSGGGGGDIYGQTVSLHKHCLAFSNNFNSGGDCVVCRQQIIGPHYSCDSCPKFFIHNYPCFEVSDHIQHHPFHPQHTLTLSDALTIINSDSEDLYYCGVCSNDLDADGDYVYRCDECPFCMDVKCASLSLTNCKSHDHQPSSLHPHPLILCDKNKNFCYKCTCCELPIEIEGGSLYACLQCRALLHKSCAHLPRKLEHPLHTSHPLVLLYGCHWITCQVCSVKMQGFFYHCSECNFYMDVHCAALKPTETNKGYKLYADLPQVIDHLLHPPHGLRFCYSSGLSKDRTLPCGACLRSSRGFFFECQLCKWYIDVGCALAKYTPMMSKIHHHPLILFDKANNLFECNSCGRCCYTPFFRCFRCDFNLHVHCVSILPRTLKYNNHVHPLTLTNSPIKDHADEDDNAEFYCGACEELRVLADPSYYCEECTYVAHPHCIVSKNISILEEECSKVESDTRGNEYLREECSKQESNASGSEGWDFETSEQVSNASGSEGWDFETSELENDACESDCLEEPSSPTVKEFLDSFKLIDKKGVERLSQYYNVIEHYRSSGFNRLDEIIKLTIRNYESANQIEVPWRAWDPTSKVVPIGDYMILDYQAHILRALVAKYGDFGCNCRWTSKMKMLCMMVVCDAIGHMCDTKVEHVTVKLLLSWFCSLRIALRSKIRNLKLEMKLELKRALRSLGLDCRPDALKLKGQKAGLGLL
ncbi:hypothetical protein Acr_00g0053790 [Actinidia rufa]|uniref:DC1 domain-containing protein n=1 Tax=Actinidia rufa TaxID=165716 RepID=A0A7J0DLF9_9ERIC|nr:hypothetical protein Acr_00g0053790 [Actinidia rufa]